MATRKVKLARCKRKYFCRSIGTFVNGRGRVNEKKIILGVDEQAAQWNIV